MTRLLAMTLFMPLLFLPDVHAGSRQAVPAAEPVWQELVFERRSMWTTARSRLSLGKREQDPFGPSLVLRLEGSLASNTERETQLLATGSYALLQRDRLTRGKNQRLKQYRYGADQVERIRREPGASEQQDPEQWPVSSRRALPFPVPGAGGVVTSAQALLALAGAVIEGPQQPPAVYVHTDVNFYRVRLVSAGEETLDVDYTLAGGSQRVRGKRSAVIVRLETEPAGIPEDPPDLTLIGLGGEISIALDKQTGLPLQVRGSAPRLGKTSIDLVAAERSQPGGGETP